MNKKNALDEALKLIVVIVNSKKIRKDNFDFFAKHIVDIYNKKLKDFEDSYLVLSFVSKIFYQHKNLVNGIEEVLEKRMLHEGDFYKIPLNTPFYPKLVH